MFSFTSNEWHNLSAAQRAHEYNLDAAHAEIRRREAEGEDMSGYAVDVQTCAVVKVAPPVVQPLRSGAVAQWDNPC